MKVVMKKTRDSVADIIEEMIFHEHLEPGERLIEAELVKKLGVSRTSIREGLLVLEQRGLVKNQPYKGATIAEHTAEDVRQMHECRFCLESYAARLALPHFTDEDFHELETLVQKMRDAARREDMQEMVTADYAFHALILNRAGNKYIQLALKSTTVVIRRFSFMQKRLQHQLAVIPERHQALLDALRRGDPAEVTALLRKHMLEHSLEGILDWMRSRT